MCRTNHLPDLNFTGFQRDSVKVTYVASSRTVRITGERQIQGTRWYRFDQSYPIPDYIEPEALGAKFETPVLTLTMPKKATSQEKGVVDEPKPDQKLQDTTTTPQPSITIGDTRSSEPIKDQAVERVGPSGEPQMGEKDLEAKPRTATVQRDEKIQKGREEFEPKPTPTRTATMQRHEKIQKGQEIESKPTPTLPTKMETDEKPQKGQEDFEPKPTPTMIKRVETAEKPKKGEEEFEPKAASTMEPNTKTDAQPPKGQEEDEPKADITNVTRKPTVKEQLKEKKTEETRDEDSEKTSYEDAEGTTDEDEDEEKERITKREVKEEPYKSRKSVKDKKQTDFGQKETETEKLLAKEAETSATKAHKEKEKQSNDITSLKKELKSEENEVEKVGSVSQVFTKFAEGALNEEEKKLAANIGAAVLVIAALGYYVSYRFAS
ncbi:hypothetical protein LR48_Vigan08g049100 [Vigna angularis]|uniref:Inactive protein n=1 Tax=Phaseolus angularis TaxID=3914 RepID=A0A0L9V4M0_PHAAN|nr:Inactive protein [Vigna angularis]KOM49664.1 hypothetical protein LR48_Vigan08g049100 [Vigna angularis]